jgi:hypothetical protein
MVVPQVKHLANGELHLLEMCECQVSEDDLTRVHEVGQGQVQNKVDFSAG